MCKIGDKIINIQKKNTNHQLISFSCITWIVSQCESFFFLDMLVCFLFLIIVTKINHQKTEWWHFHILPFSVNTCDFIHDLEYGGKPHMTYLLWKMLKPLLYAWWKISSEANVSYTYHRAATNGNFHNLFICISFIIIIYIITNNQSIH